MVVATIAGLLRREPFAIGTAALVLAGADQATRRALQTALSSPGLRIYRNDDPLGADLVGLAISDRPDRAFYLSFGHQPPEVLVLPVLDLPHAGQVAAHDGTAGQVELGGRSVGRHVRSS